MVQIDDKAKCCGCEACVQVCPKNCISTVLDSEGFLYPKVDESQCIHCEKCILVCPVLHPGQERIPVSAFAAKNLDLEIREISSSGGVFSALATYVFNKNGIVFGAGFNEKFEVVHQAASNQEELAALRGSKYVQSRVGNIFAQVKSLLQSGRFVLFTGTPCQVAGLRNYLHRDYDNLLIVDVACHGVPSPEIWQRYLNEICQKHHSSIGNIRFRDKVTGWKSYSISIRAKNGKVLECQPFFHNLYMKGFLGNYILRPSCYACPFRVGRSGSDLTLADYWGVDHEVIGFSDDRGVSLVLVYTAKAEKVLGKLNVELRTTNYKDALRHNLVLEHNIAKPTNRMHFFTLTTKLSIMDSLTIITQRSLYKKILNLGYRIIQSLFIK